jgi:hypothetical protein
MPRVLGISLGSRLLKSVLHFGLQLELAFLKFFTFPMITQFDEVKGLCSMDP